MEPQVGDIIISNDVIGCKLIEKIINIDDKYITVLTLKASTTTGQEYCGSINDFDLDEFETYCRPLTDLEKVKYL